MRTIIIAALMVAIILTARGCRASAWSKPGTIGASCGSVSTGPLFVVTADNRHGFYVMLWTGPVNGLPYIAITGRGTQISPDGRKARFFSVEEWKVTHER